MKSKLLLFFALNILLDFTSSIKINNGANIAEQTKVISNYFPEVTYPTSLFEVNEPFYYTTQSDNVLEAFPDDVKNAYKSFRTTNIPSTKNTGINLEDNSLIDIAKCCAAVKNCTNNTVEKYDKMCEDDKQNFTLGEMVENSDEQNNNDENNAAILFEEGQLIQSTNDSITPNINDDQNYFGIPVQLLTENDFLKNDSDLFTSVPFTTLVWADHLNLFNNSMSEEELGIITKSFIEEDKLSNMTFNDLDEIDFQNISSELLCNYTNNVHNVSSDFMILQPEMEEIFDPDSHESTYSYIDEYSIHTINNESFTIPEDCHKINSPIIPIGINYNETISTEVARQFVNNEDKVQNKGSDSFLELIISLNQLLQNDDFQHIHDYEKQANSIEFEPSK